MSALGGPASTPHGANCFTNVYLPPAALPFVSLGCAAPRCPFSVASLPPPPAPPDVVFALVGDVRASSRALRQLRALADLGCHVDALTFGPEPVPDEVADGVRLHVLPRPSGRGPLFFWQAHRLFLREALARPASVYHASDLYVLPALAAAARRHDARLLLDARELYPHVDATAGKPWARWAWSAVEHRFLPRTDAVLTVNDSIADRMAATYGIARPDRDAQRAAAADRRAERCAPRATRDSCVAADRVVSGPRPRRARARTPRRCDARRARRRARRHRRRTDEGRPPTARRRRAPRPRPLPPAHAARRPPPPHRLGRPRRARAGADHARVSGSRSRTSCSST